MTLDGTKLYKEGDLIDYYRKPDVKDEDGGWNGPYEVIRNEPQRERVVCQVRSKETKVHYHYARLTLYVEALQAPLNYPVDVNTALATVIGYRQNMPLG